MHLSNYEPHRHPGAPVRRYPSPRRASGWVRLTFLSATLVIEATIREYLRRFRRGFINPPPPRAEALLFLLDNIPPQRTRPESRSRGRAWERAHGGAHPPLRETTHVPWPDLAFWEGNNKKKRPGSINRKRPSSTHARPNRRHGVLLSLQSSIDPRPLELGRRHLEPGMVRAIVSHSGSRIRAL